VLSRRRLATLLSLIAALCASLLYVSLATAAQRARHTRKHHPRHPAHRIVHAGCAAASSRRHSPRRNRLHARAHRQGARRRSVARRHRGAHHHARPKRHARRNACAAPANRAAPGIAGAPLVGQTLSASAGAWTGTGPIRYSYSWQRDGSAIPGATGASYALMSTDVGSHIRVVVTASNRFGSRAASSGAASVQGVAVAAAPASGGPFETWEGFSAANPMPAGRTPGNASSPFNQPVGSPGVLPDSPQLVAWLLAHHETRSAMPGTMWSGPEHEHPTVYAANSDPVVELVPTEAWGPNALRGRRIRIPAQAQADPPGPPSDAHLEIVLAPSDARVPGETAELWRAEPVSEGKLRFAWGSPGNIAGSLLGGQATASDIDLSAGQVRAPELKAGIVPHALCAAVPQTKSAHVYPAAKSDGTSGEAGAPAMGQRFYLAYSEGEIEALPVPPWKRAVLKALADYGFYVCDSGNDTLGFEFESPIMYTAFGQPNWFAVIGQEQGLASGGGNYLFDFSEGVDWTRLRAIAPPGA
jgi:hypothetical protein